MRSDLILSSLVLLAACASPTPRTAPQIAAPLTDAAFVVPMDPGSIQCDRLSNPAALAVASDWAMGQARAAALSGRIAAAPDAATLSNSLSQYCGSNSGNSVRTAVSQVLI